MRDRRSERVKTGRAWTTLALLGAGGLIGCTLEQSAPAKPSPPAPAARGQALYGAYCADCHGPLAHGDGPRALTLVRAPADLTTIARRNGGVFSADAVASYVDGRTDIEAHGTREMPVWGRVLDDRNQALDEDFKLTPSWIAQIVAYLQAIQEPQR
jgi:mono/diheme cytochrome c family protein